MFEKIINWFKPQQRHGNINFLEFRIKIKPVISKINDLDDDIDDSITELSDISSHKMGNFRQWSSIIDYINNVRKSYLPLLKHLQKYPVDVKDKDVPKYKNELKVLLNLTLKNLDEKFDQYFIQLINLRSIAIKSWGPRSDETMHLQVSLNFMRRLKKIIREELAIIITEYLNQKE